MQLSPSSITAIQKLLTGDALERTGKAIAPYRTGWQIGKFFEECVLGQTSEWGSGSRWDVTEDRLRELNGKPGLQVIIEEGLDPQHFFDTEFTPAAAADHLNRYLARDGYEVRMRGERHRVHVSRNSLVVTSALGRAVKADSMEFVREQIEKCESKLGAQDNDGAITNARSMLEAVLCEIERQRDEAAPAYDGDLPRLYKRVQKLLALDPARSDIPDSIKQILTGLTAIVNGIAAARNKMADAHVRTYKPAAHHARVVVNAAMTIAEFVVSSQAHQRSRGN